MKESICIILLLVIVVKITNAQSTEYGPDFKNATTHYENLLPLEEYEKRSLKEYENKCFQKCLFADKWTWATEQHLIKEASTKVKIIPPVLDTLIETVLIGSLLNGTENKYKNDTLIIVKTPSRDIPIEISAEYYTVKKRKLVGKCGGWPEVVEVVCPKLIDEYLVGKIQIELNNEGYYNEINTGVFDVKTKKALFEYQKLNRHCVGILDLKTLKALGVI